MKKRNIDSAIDFYTQSPTGQCDEEAVMALEFVRKLLDFELDEHEEVEEINKLRAVMLVDVGI